MKAFSEGEFIKECLIIYTDIVLPEKSDEVHKICLSRRTVTRRITDLAADVRNQCVIKCKEYEYFSVAVDESTDAKDNAQLAIFIRGINSDFAVFEEFLELVPLKSTTTGVDIFEAVKSSLEKFKLVPLKLVSVTTDGAPAMVGKNKGFVTLLEKTLIELGNQNNLIKLHCIIHQEALCAKNTDE